MTDLPIADIWTLPAPVLVYELSFEEQFEARRDQFRQLWANSKKLKEIAPDFDVWMLESDPIVILLQCAAYGDLHFIAALNEWARVVLLAHFAKKGDLDAHAAREGLELFPDESDELLLERIILERLAKNAYGTDPWYMRHARNADGRVRDVAITGNGRRKVEVAVLSTDNGGVPTPDLINKLNGILPLPPIARNNDIVNVVPAILETTDVEADYWLDEGAPLSLLDGIEDIIKGRWNTGKRLGRDLTRSWYCGQLQVPGVYKIEGKTPNIIIPSNRGVAIGNVKLNYRGRGW